MADVAAIESLEAHDQALQALQNKGGGVAVLYVWASWYPACQQMMQVIQEAAKEFPNLSFFHVQDTCAEVLEKYPIESVPTVFVLKAGQVAETIKGANPPLLLEILQRYAAAAPAPAPVAPAAAGTTPGASVSAVDGKETKEQLNARLAKLVKASPVMLFMKGNPDAPRCGFSRQMVELLKEEDITFGYFDILTDETVRLGLKEYSNWPTYPQLYVEGKLVGGLDVAKELHNDGELAGMVPDSCKKGGKATLEAQLKALINQAPVMLFMKGSPDTPKCGFSAKMVELLKGAGATFGHFDILTDDSVRQGLKEYSNWPTYPQLYVKGKLIGGLDVVTDLQSEGELESVLAEAAEADTAVAQ